jgi:hypothetical protein
MKVKNNLGNKSMTKRVFPRIHADQYQKLLIIAQKRGQNLSSLTRSLYTDLLDKEFPNQKPAV